MKLYLTMLLFAVTLGTLVQATSQPDETSKAEWETVQTYEGSGSSQTPIFDVPSVGEFRVMYVSNGTTDDGTGHIFQLYLLKPGQEVWEGKLVANQSNQKRIRGSSNLYAPGKYYLNANASNCRWKVFVQRR